MLTDLAFRLAERGVSVAGRYVTAALREPTAALPPYEVVNGVTIYRVSTAVRGRARLVGRALDYLSFHVAAGRALLKLLAVAMLSSRRQIRRSSRSSWRTRRVGVAPCS